MLSDVELAQKLASLQRINEGIYGLLLITNDGFVLQSSLPPSVDLDRLWEIAAPYTAGESKQIELAGSVLMIEPGPDATLLALVHAAANITLIKVALQHLAHVLTEPLAGMLQ